MAFQNDPNNIVWKIHLAALPEVVYTLLSTNDGRAQFWAESAVELEKHINFVFPNDIKWRGKVLEAVPNKRYQVEYYGGSIAAFDLESDGSSGTILTLTDKNVPAEDRGKVTAGWVSVLLALKAAADFNVDLRSHDSRYTWDKGFADN